ncbi:Peroxidase, family 2-domain-containing protein [Aspergillus cavernicola]|uniref:Peroxidase, family 2-domain-containing protein n=1 Tax=Aspergillus cavernicola TaxID=176166 RepID=A0ABR4HW98_9EURO
MWFKKALFGLVPAFILFGAAQAELDFEKWHPAGVTDLRCGCPAMNSLANHGFLNHNGSNITVGEVIPLMKEVFHLSEELATIVTGLAVLGADDPASGIFNLDMLNRHNIFEHDASLTRKDFRLGGDGHTIDKPALNKFLGFFKGKQWVDLNDAAAARYARVLESRIKNPTFLYQDQQIITSYGETMKYFRTMVDPRSNKTSAEFVKILFTEERLPVREGWRRPAQELSGFSLASDVVQLALRTPETFIGRPFDQRPFAEQAFDPLPWQRPPIWKPPVFPGFSKRDISDFAKGIAKKALSFRA